MALTPIGLNVPAATDPFDPQVDFSDLADSLVGRTVIPVATTAAYTALVAAVAPSPSKPLWAYVQDSAALRVHDGTTDRLISKPTQKATISYTTVWGPRPAPNALTLQIFNDAYLFVGGGITNPGGQAGNWLAYQQLTFGSVPAPFRPATGQWEFSGANVISGTGFWGSILTIKADGTLIWQPGNQYGALAPVNSVWTMWSGVMALT